MGRLAPGGPACLARNAAHGAGSERAPGGALKWRPETLEALAARTHQIHLAAGVLKTGAAVAKFVKEVPRALTRRDVISRWPRLITTYSTTTTATATTATTTTTAATTTTTAAATRRPNGLGAKTRAAIVAG